MDRILRVLSVVPLVLLNFMYLAILYLFVVSKAVISLSTTIAMRYQEPSKNPSYEVCKERL